jgi:hypothetical protein
MSEYALVMSDRLLYQVTLTSGRIVTNPEAFGDADEVRLEDYYRPIFAEDGRILSVEAEAKRLSLGAKAPEPSL